MLKPNNSHNIKRITDMEKELNFVLSLKFIFRHKAIETAKNSDLTNENSKQVQKVHELSAYKTSSKASVVG